MDVKHCYGITPTQTRPRYYEAHDLIKQAWTRPRAVRTSTASTRKLRNVNVWPQPIQKPHPPIWLAGWRLASRRGSSTAKLDYIYCYLRPSSATKRGQAAHGWLLASDLDKNGTDHNPYPRGLSRRSSSSRRPTRRPRAGSSIRSTCTTSIKKSSARLGRSFAAAPGYRTRQDRCRAAAEARRWQQPRARKRAPASTMSAGSHLRDESKATSSAGSPQTVRRAAAGTAIRRLRVRPPHSVLMQLGSMHARTELAFKNTELFAKEVMPHVRDMWPGYQGPVVADGRAASGIARYRRSGAAEEDRMSTETIELKLPSGLAANVLKKGRGAPLVFFHSHLDKRCVHHAIAARVRGEGTAAIGTETKRTDAAGCDQRSGAVLRRPVRRAVDRRSVLVGHSFGGMVAAEYASYFTSKVRKLVLIDALGLWVDATPVADINGMSDQKIPALLFADAGGSAAVICSRCRPIPLPWRRQSSRACRRAQRCRTSSGRFPHRDLRRRLYRIAAPTLVVWGNADRYIPPLYADEFVAGIARAAKALIAGADTSRTSRSSAKPPLPCWRSRRLAHRRRNEPRFQMATTQTIRKPVLESVASQARILVLELWPGAPLRRRWSRAFRRAPRPTQAALVVSARWYCG